MRNKFGRRAPKALKVVRWVKHRSPLSILRAFCPAGFKPKEIADDGMWLVGVKQQGQWAFVETKAKPPVVHYWQDGTKSPEDMMFMLGHELGHLVGKKLRGWNEEMRADDYGWVAAALWRKLAPSRSERRRR
jgi:hypothetical protein